MSTPNDKLKQFRLAKGVSQAELAEIAGCDHTRISKAESGVNDLQSPHVSRILRYYDCSPGSLGYESVTAYRRRPCQ